jgi:hypothetical protein
MRKVANVEANTSVSDGRPSDHFRANGLSARTPGTATFYS